MIHGPLQVSRLQELPITSARAGFRVSRFLDAPITSGADGVVLQSAGSRLGLNCHLSAVGKPQPTVPHLRTAVVLQPRC
jgi:hypothetical protein